MHIANPATVLAPTALEIPVLEVLSRTEKPMTGRQVHRLSRSGSQSGVQYALDRLVSSGLVFGERAGRSVLYRANRQHLAWPAAEVLFSLRATLIARLGEAVSGLEPAPAQAELFGSVARGDGDEASDIDVLLVHDDESNPWVDATYEIGRLVHLWTGNHVQWVVVSSSRWNEMTNASDPLVESVRADGINLLDGATA